MTMKNEMLVDRIRNGCSVTDNMQTLYENNLPLIRKFIKPFSNYGEWEDILQESFFGLWEAVRHYESSEGCAFSTYMKFWIRQSVQRYLEKCGSTVRIPSHTRQKIIRYKKTVQEMEQELGRTPTDKEIADKMRVPVGLLLELKTQMKGIASLDTPLAEDNSLTLADTIQADFSLEDETIDKMYTQYCGSELWGVVERFTSDRENDIIKELFINKKTMAQVAREQGVALERVRQIKQSGLRRLRRGKARRELRQKFDIADSALYRGSYASYDEHYFTSVVEHITLKKMEAKERYKRHLAEVAEMGKIGAEI